MGILIGIDYGEKRTGIAVSDPLQIIASPLCTLPPQEAVAFLEQYCRENDVETIVVGLPRHTYSCAAPVEVEGAIRDFIGRLERTLPTNREV